MEKQEIVVKVKNVVKTNVFDTEMCLKLFINHIIKLMWVHKVARINKSSAFEITSQTDEVMSCFSHQAISSSIFLSQWTFSSGSK